MNATTPTEAESKSKPLWQMDLRHKLGLEPGRNDAVAILLNQAIYTSDDIDEAAERIEFDLSEIQKALRIIREEL